MQLLNKEVLKRDAHPVIIGAPSMGRWELFMPTRADEQDTKELLDTQKALVHAETVIRAQEERIQQLQQMALTDELTGLANRRGFTLAFEREISMARRDGDYSGLLVLVDLDGFKSINDTWGHQAGDAYLQLVAKCLQGEVRGSDTVARLGGDEFAILLTHVDEKNGAKRLAKLEQSFSRKALMLEKPVPLRASFGYACYDGAHAIETVIQSADLHLYAHKSRNKNLLTA